MAFKTLAEKIAYRKGKKQAFIECGCDKCKKSTKQKNKNNIASYQKDDWRNTKYGKAALRRVREMADVMCFDEKDISKYAFDLYKRSKESNSMRDLLNPWVEK